MEKTYIFGHRKPDTDSVTSAISLAYLKKKLGVNAEARVLGSINKETKYALQYFDVKEPKYLNDVRLQLKDIEYHRHCFLKQTNSIYDSYLYMLNQGLTGVPIINENGIFIGIVTIKDLAHHFIRDDIQTLDTSIDNLLSVLKAEVINKAQEEVKGELLAASYRSTTFINDVELNSQRILIVGDRHSVIEYALNSGVQMLIISGNRELKEEHIKLAQEKKISIIRSPYDTYHIARLVNLANYIGTMTRTTKDAIVFDDTAYVDDILEINKKLRHTNYPVVNSRNGKCLGLLKITDLEAKNPKKVILVDHNEKKQSAEGIDQAEIQEIIDHHNLGSITTEKPINFRNMAVGCTCTIVYTLFKEKKIEIPKEIAGMLLSGVLSDTLILKSPTATQLDVETVYDLAKIAQVDYKKYGMELLKAGTSLDGMSCEDVLYTDFKLYTVEDKTMGIAQFFTMNFDEIKKELDSYVDTLDEVAEANHYSVVALYVTDIITEGSYVLYNRKAKAIFDLAYKKDMQQGDYIENCVARKKQIVPLLMEVLEK